MQCVIIAAGQGTRLRELAESKPLAPVAGAPLIEHVVRLAKAGGASEFLVVTGYEAARVEDFLPDLSGRVGAPIHAVRNPDWAQPNGVSVLAAADHIDGEFLLLMSDHLFDPRIVRTLISGRRAEAALTLAVDHDLENPLVDMDDATKVLIGPEQRIARIGKTIPKYDAIDTGVFLATPALFGSLRASIEGGGQGSLSEGVQTLADKGGAYALDIGKLWWADVDDAAALKRAEESFPRFAL